MNQFNHKDICEDEEKYEDCHYSDKYVVSAPKAGNENKKDPSDIENTSKQKPKVPMGEIVCFDIREFFRFGNFFRCIDSHGFPAFAGSDPNAYKDQTASDPDDEKYDGTCCHV